MDPLRRLIESSWAYVQFALNEPEHFKITLSGIIEQEQEYSAFVEATQQTFNLVVDIVAQGQQAGLLRQGAPDLTAVSVWMLIHGLVRLLLENQISHTVFNRYSMREMFICTLNQVTLIELDPNTFALTDGM